MTTNIKTSKSLSELAKGLTVRDVDALRSIYSLRCLDANQIFQLHYYSVNKTTGKPVGDTYAKRMIKKMLTKGLIEEKIYNVNKTCYFITTQGIKILKLYFNLESEDFNKNNYLVAKGSFRKSELLLNERLIPHQLKLNQFYIDFVNSNLNVTYKYQDGKHADSFPNIIPDALIKSKDRYYFLEMDLGTESKNLLIEKWNNYIDFINSEEGSCLERKLVILFIIEVDNKLEEREKLTKLSILETIFVLLSVDFEIVIGDSKKILEYLSYDILDTYIKVEDDCVKLLKEKHCFDIIPTDNLSDFPQGKNFNYLSRISSEDKSKFFFIDFYNKYSLSSFNKIADFEHTQNLFYNIFQEKVFLLVIVDSIDELYSSLSTLTTNTKFVFYSTHERLKHLDFWDAIFQIDLSGNVYTFTHFFKTQIYSHNILEDKINNF